MLPHLLAVTVTLRYPSDELEVIYAAIVMIIVTAALCLARWTLRNMIIFIMLVATLFVAGRAAYLLYNRINIQTYTVAPC